MCDLEYFSFDVDKFFREYKDKQTRLKFLKTKYNAIPFSSSLDYETPKVSGGMPTSGVENKAERREKLEKEIQRLESYFALCDRILENLEHENQVIIKEYFIKGRKSRADVDFLADELYCSKSTFYRKVREARVAVKEYMREAGRGE